MIQEDQQSIVLCTNDYRSPLSSDEIKMIQIIEKQKGKIRKQKVKRRQLIWVPLLTKNIFKVDTEPIYIYNLFKMMKSYDEDYIEKYQNYGIQDAGIGHFDSVKFDKQNQRVEFSLSTNSLGQLDMNNLINLYKSYQNQQYYDLAQAIQEYQDFSNNHLKVMVDQICKMNYTQNQVDLEFTKFEQKVKEWLNDNLENEIYEAVIGKIDIDQKNPVIKKLIFSKNLLLFIGEDLLQTYDEISMQRNFDFLTNFLRQKNLNGSNEIEYNIKLLKGLAQQLLGFEFDFEFDDEIETFDRFVIPTKKSIRSLFYDIETGELTKDVNLHFLFITQYSFEPKWIKYLIDQRLNKNKIDQNNKNSQSILKQNMDENFEYICQKEYFLEKFNYISSINNNNDF